VDGTLQPHQLNQSAEKKTMPWKIAGALAAIAILATIIFVALPADTAAARKASYVNMKQILLGQANYQTMRRKPAADIVDQNGKPLLSWRVAILPYMEHRSLFEEFHLDEPWDSEYNIKLLSRMPKPYLHPKDKPSSTFASYFRPTSDAAAGSPDSPTVDDGGVKRIILVEARREIPWTKPEDIPLDPDPAHPLPNFGGFFSSLFHAGFNDSKVLTISQTTDPATLRPFFTTAGGQESDREKIAVP
jgi:hypothetical protein